MFPAANNKGMYTNSSILFGAVASSVTGMPLLVNIQSAPAVRMGDPLAGGDVVAKGSSNVFIHSQPAARVTDTTGAGGLILIGATNVFIGG
jgi:uncharacterized Zn-binding protein involved in type VI secretion